MYKTLLLISLVIACFSYQNSQARDDEYPVQAAKEEKERKAAPIPQVQRAAPVQREERTVRAPREDREVRAPREERVVRAPREEREVRAPIEQRSVPVVTPTTLERRELGSGFNKNISTDQSLREWHARDRNYLYSKRSARIGSHKFAFTPRRHSNYRVWIDAYPVDYIEQEYTTVDLSEMEASVQEVGDIVNDTVTIHGLTFELTFDAPLSVGRESVAHIVVSKYGYPFTQLEPFMGEFGHIVMFNEDSSTFSYIHPMGREPGDPSDLGGPELLFGLEPNRSGYIKLFVQVRVQGENIFAPFGVMIE